MLTMKLSCVVLKINRPSAPSAVNQAPSAAAASDREFTARSCVSSTDWPPRHRQNKIQTRAELGWQAR